MRRVTSATKEERHEIFKKNPERLMLLRYREKGIRRDKKRRVYLQLRSMAPFALRDERGVRLLIRLFPFRRSV